MRIVKIWKQSSAIKKFIVLNILAFFLLTSSCSRVMNGSQKLYEENKALAPYDVIIVPGVPFDGIMWSNTMKLRVYWSYYLWQNGMVKNIIYSGSAVYTPYIESEIMAAYARELGIPDAIIFQEKQAEHSTENIYYSEKMARELGFNKIALATDPFQNNMVNSFRKRHYKHIAVLPAQFDIIDTMITTDPIIDDKLYLQNEFVSLPDREGFFKRMRGTMGKHIIDSIKN